MTAHEVLFAIKEKKKVNKFAVLRNRHDINRILMSFNYPEWVHKEVELLIELAKESL